ncbi:autotransporter outer membrane beta-barrel domain-containing protein [Candidatus Bartonella raoultii]|uniref:Autotransporter outer membrane beta-barrel domain-containing protein n=2 Tax=Bartonella raoultii TaxID=1457020 RepID=A0ABS7I9E7_9HYPH|nr:autotransporter outer membrane beta-barrel domain-containing protein [Bartonella raoultii]
MHADSSRREGGIGDVSLPPIGGTNRLGISGGFNYYNLSGESGESSGEVNTSVQHEKADGKGLEPLFYFYNGLYYVCDNCGEGRIDNQSYKITRDNASHYPSDPTAITVKKIGTRVQGKNVIVGSEVPDKNFLRAVSVSEDGKVVLIEPKLENVNTALFANNGIVEIKKGMIKESNKAVEAIGHSLVILEGTEINTRNGPYSFLSHSGANIWMEGGMLDFKDSNGVSAVLGGKVVFDGVTINGEGTKDKGHAVFVVDEGASVDFQGNIKTKNTHGVFLKSSVIPSDLSASSSEDGDEDEADNFYVTEINLKSSSVKVNGEGYHGIYFKRENQLEESENKKENLLEKEKTPARLDVVTLSKTNFSALGGAAIYGQNKVSGAVSLSQSTLSGHSLLKAEHGASVILLVDASTLRGGSSVDEHSNAELYLGSGSTWILQQNLQGNQPKSNISLVSLMDESSINFKRLKSSSTYDYQTLTIGTGKGEVYRARGGAHIFINSYLNGGGALGHQMTDRVLIDGDVSGTTLVHVRAVEGSPGGSTGNGGNTQGISVIQVSGNAEENSFQLAGGYVTLGELPYQYQLSAYGPQSHLGAADQGQRLVKGSGDFWDFRLESKYMDSQPSPTPTPPPGPTPTPPPGPTPTPPPGPTPTPPPSPKPGVKAVAPQVSTYLLLPNALFQVGLMDIRNQNQRLEALRTFSGEEMEKGQMPYLFLRGYGGSHRYTSDLSMLEYGYGGELDYHAVEAGVLLSAIESAYSTASFGVMGSYTQFSLQPLDVAQSQKSPFHKWSVMAYGGLKHDTGFYVDGLLSYGLFEGDVRTLARDKTATLKGHPLNASLTAGKMFMTGEEGLTVDPQIQVVYQHLQFKKARDIDNFDIEMGKLDQWVVRAGGRVTKTLDVSDDEPHVVSFYGKLYLSHGLGGKKSVHFKDAFKLGSFGSSLETGIGFNAQLSQNFTLYGDLAYQHKLTKSGFSGTSFSGGLSYHF